MVNSKDSRLDPILPIEIVNLVLGQLEKSELLKFRLVSKTWNALCLDHLRASDSTQYLKGIHNVRKYVEFVKKANAQPILPFRLLISSKFGGVVNSFYSDMDDLINWIGLGSIVSLECRDLDDMQLSQFFPFLEGLFPSLVELELTNCVFPTHVCEHLIEAMHRAGHPKSLPKLKTFSYTPNKEHFSKEEMEMLCFLMSKFTGLEKLEYNGPLGRGNVGFKVPFKSGLKSLQLSGLVNPDLLYSQLNTDKNLLGEFKYDYSGWMYKRETIGDIFRGFSPSLKSMDYHLEWIGLDRYTGVGIPAFPLLKKLNFCVKLWLDGSKHLSNSSLTPANLVSLKCVSMPFGLYWTTEVFYTVECVNLQVRNVEKNIEIMEDYIKYLFRVFPNVRKLSLEGMSGVCGEYISQISTHLDFQSIQCLELQNYKTEHFLDFLVKSNPYDDIISCTKHQHELKSGFGLNLNSDRTNSTYLNKLIT